MNWDAIGAIAELLGAIGVIASLVYLAGQVRQSRDQMRENTRALQAGARARPLTRGCHAVLDRGPNPANRQSRPHRTETPKVSYSLASRVFRSAHWLGLRVHLRSHRIFTRIRFLPSLRMANRQCNEEGPVYAMGSPPDRPDLTRANRGSCNLHEPRNHHLSKKIYVGNLPFSVTEQELRGLFESHGDIDSVNVIMDRETGRARGFAFVEMSEASAADNAIRSLDGSDMGGRSLRVNEAEDKRGGGGGGYRR